MKKHEKEIFPKYFLTTSEGWKLMDTPEKTFWENIIFHKDKKKRGNLPAQKHKRLYQN